MATRVPALIQLSDPRVAAQLVNNINVSCCKLVFSVTILYRNGGCNAIFTVVTKVSSTTIGQESGCNVMLLL